MNYEIRDLILRLKKGIIKFQYKLRDIINKILLNEKSLNGTLESKNKLILLKIDYETIILKLKEEMEYYKRLLLYSTINKNSIF